MLPGKKYTVQDIVRLAVEGKWLLVIPVLVCAFAALVASSFVHDRFQSDMLIQVVPQRVPDAYVRSTVTVRTDEQRIDAISEQVKSRTQLEQLINTFGLYQVELAKKPLSDVVDRMRNDIDVEVVRGVNQPADAFHVRFTYRDPEVAAK